MTEFSHEELIFFRHHFFLPPGLPQEDDHDVDLENAVLRLVIEALEAFGGLVSEHQRSIVHNVTAAVRQLYETRDHDGFALLKALKTMSQEEFSVTIPIHISAQNAGIVFSTCKQSGGVLFEAFEVSPTNNAAMSTEGRLRRCFPGPVLLIEKKHFENPEFLSTLAKTLSKMTFQKAIGSTPKVRKSQNDVDEKRDTTDPRIVTELLVAFLQPYSSVPTAHKIWKNTREEVLWHNTDMPWRRSPIWLLLRTVMQLLFSRSQMVDSSQTDTVKSLCLYKLFMVYLLASVLSKSIAVGESTDPDIISCMSAKIHRRLLKLNPAEDEPGIAFVQDVLEKTRQCLEERWSSVQNLDNKSLNLEGLKTLEFESDASLLLPGLDDFLSSIPNRSLATDFGDFSPSPELLKLTPGKLPVNGLFGSDDYMIYNLSAFESWVSSALPDWLAVNIKGPETCGDLETLMKNYHSSAKEYYSGNPETCSVMLLTLLELWIACDKSALALFPKLGDYDPGVQLESLQSLVLPLRGQMIRLLSIEKYLRDRRATARLGTEGSIFRDFGTPSCFSVRYYDESPKHEDLLHKIEANATEERRRKCEELSDKKLQYNNLVREYERRCCDTYESTNFFGGRVRRHNNSCQKCTLKSKYENIQIDVHEWPLPSKELEKKSVVFELDAPEAFCAWRDLTVFLLLDVFGVAYGSSSRPRAAFPLDQYTALQQHFRGSRSRRLGLLSEDKPHVVTHRKRPSIPNTTEWDICLNNGLNFHYYDSTQGCFVGHLSHSDSVPKMCTYQLPESASTLQPFLFRRFRGQDSTPNEVISSQSGCPEHLSLEEYRCLAGIPVGYRLQWQNILSQLSIPLVDFKKLETSLVIFQAIYQVGPQETEDFRRGSHLYLAEEKFFETLLSAVDVATGRIEKNWESYQALSVFNCIVTRQLSLSPSPALATKALEVLSKLRDVVFGWLEKLRGKRDKTEDEIQRNEFAEKIVVTAMICSGTFDVDDSHLEEILMEHRDASILIQCGVLIHELLLPTHVAIQSSLLSILYRRWQRLSWRAYPALFKKVDHIDASTCLDHAVMNCWPKFRRQGCWEAATSQIDHWVVSNTEGGSGQSLQVQFNLLTGDLLVNGLPLSRPPPQYEKHETYAELFGGIVLQIMPSSKPGMKFSSKQCYADHSLDFGLNGSDLLVHASKNDVAFELVPKRVFRGKLPSTFVDKFVHWYDTTAGIVEFRSTQQPWTLDSDTWILARVESGWKLSKRELTLINPMSPTGEQLAGVFAPLQHRLQINITLAGNGQTLEVELPRLKLAFFLSRGESSVLSRQFRGMEIDHEQYIGTLIGLKNRLVIKNTSTGDRRVIIPFGEVSFARYGDHVSVSIEPAPTSTHVYRLDPMLGLRDNGNLQSKLFLCYLHAITSFCLPDVLTNSTGTEQALSILKSAAVMSTPLLNVENMALLRDIEALSPRRLYYPDHLKVMQTIVWDTRLPVLSQHAQFHQCVMGLWDQMKLAKLYHPEDYIEPPHIGDMTAILLRRDNVRSSTFRISGFGAEDFSNTLDVTYKSRDLGQSSDASKRAGLAAAMFFHRRPNLQYQVSGFMSRILSLLKTVDTVQGPNNPEATQSMLDYDGRWLDGHAKHWADLWCWLHRQSQSTLSDETKKPQLMMWLATMAFSSDADMNMIQVAASLFSLPHLRDVWPPQIRSFRLQEGDNADEDILREVVRRHCLSYYGSPEFAESGYAGEETWGQRNAQYEENKDRAVNKLTRHLVSQWPSHSPAPPSGYTKQSICDYVYLDQAMSAVKPIFQVWHENLRFKTYIQQIGSIIDIQSVEPLSLDEIHSESPRYTPTHQKTFISSADLFMSTPSEAPRCPEMECFAAKLLTDDWDNKPGQQTSQTMSPARSKLESLIQDCKTKASSPYENEYAEEMNDSLESLRSRFGVQTHSFEFKTEDWIPLLKQHLDDSVKYADNLLGTMKRIMYDGLRSRFSASILSPGPRISPVFLLRQLSHGGWDSQDGWGSLPRAWKRWIVAYGLAITEVQRTRRLKNSLYNIIDLERELGNKGHTNWDPMEFPDSLLLEIESDIMIREVQEHIASKMRQPPDNQNAVMQLNMGEGKSSVIAPAVTAALADGSRLVRVVVAKPQSRQMFHMLVSKLGGLLNRRIFHLPFSRDLQCRLTIADAMSIQNECRRCIDVGGVMLVQPEHVLSFKLMGLQSLITGKEEIGQSLLQTQHLFDTMSRDIVDESDENFSVKFELIYTMGEQGPIEFAPERWTVIQTVLKSIRDHVQGVKEVLPKSIEVTEAHEGHSGSFPRIRLLREDATEMLLGKVAYDICSEGFVGFPISRQPPATRESVLKYISHTSLSPANIEKVEKGVFWTETTRHHLLLLRGLFAGGILAFAFGYKRWRVNYGLDNTRRPPTKLAVPYRAKDLPTQRSEFSHPDVVITLTCACYYYEGLSNEDLFLSFEHLLRSNQAAAEYDEWTYDSHHLPHEFQQLEGINMKDTVQCIKEVFPSFRYAKRTIDYFLQFIVFPKQMKEFPRKLSTSGWDIGAAKTHPTTGFSGTVDSKTVLPLDVEYLPLDEQKSTNALVLENLLRPENGVILLDPISKDDIDHGPSLNLQPSEAENLLSVVVGQQNPPIRVILDVGAQILELTNAQVATRWLAMTHDRDSAVQGAIYFDDNEELMVVDISGFVETLRTSPYGEHLDACLVFLDEAHTRGTDLKLPQDYRAAVTLGASLTRDRLAQACMRMRKLGEGQSVVFCVPQEIQTKIKERMSPTGGTDASDRQIDIPHVLEWAISETHNDIRKSVSLWKAQGQRFEHQRLLWNEARTDRGIDMKASHAEKFLEEEAQTLEQRYRPKLPSKDKSSDAISKRLLQIQDRCEKVGSTNLDEATLQEEQERELSPETEQERQLERPPPAEAARHSIHTDLQSAITSGILHPTSPAFIPAFEALRKTSAAQHLDVSMFPKDVLVTADFAQTIKETAIAGSVLDSYQRPVQWVLTSQPNNWNHIVIISPHEAQELLPAIQSSGSMTLHIYAPRPNLSLSPLDGLDLYMVPSSSMQAMTPIPIQLKIQLNLYAGQLYFEEFSEYVAFCKMFRLSWQKASEGLEIAADGFILAGNLDKTTTFTESPVKFLKVHLMTSRRDCQSIEKTHLGKLLDGALLERHDFKSQGMAEKGLPIRLAKV